MKLVLNRKFKSTSYTIGDLFIDGKFFCNTIEDGSVSKSVSGEVPSDSSDMQI